MIGWCAAFVLAVAAIRLRRRLELVARAEHELRAPLTAFGLALESARRSGSTALAHALDAELARARIALADLSAARAGRRAHGTPKPVQLGELVRSSVAAWAPAARDVRVEWNAGEVAVDADRGRLAQAIGNVLANAVEHGDGELELRAHRRNGSVRLEVLNGTRGRGLSIAAAAARDSGGELSLTTGAAGARAVLELPVAR